MPNKILPIILLAFANEREDENSYLRNLHLEQRELRNILNKFEDEELAQVEILNSVTISDLFNFFQNERNRGRVVAFHYGGHANSFQLLLETEDGENQAAHGEGLLSFLTKQENLELVVLNGCSTKGHSHKLVESGIATITTSNSIDDKVATEFAKRFYAAIVNQIPLKQAFDEAQDYVITLKGSANIRDLYFEGAAPENVPNKVPWQLLLPNTLASWTPQQAYDQLNITLAERAQRELKELLENGAIDSAMLKSQVTKLIERGNISRLLKYMLKEFSDEDTYLGQYMLDIKSRYRKTDKDITRGRITDEAGQIMIGNLFVEIQELVLR